MPKGKAIVLIGNNNQNEIQQMITGGYYTYLFSSSKTVLLKKFKANILNNPLFTQQISLLAIDKEYLVKK